MNRTYMSKTPAPEARDEKPHSPAIGEAVPEIHIATYRNFGCWTPRAEITPGACEATLDIFACAGLISTRFAYEQVCAPPPVEGPG